MKQTCLFCGHTVNLIHVHGHYQCPVCNTNALPCCDSDNCETNLLLKQSPENSRSLRTNQPEKPCFIPDSK